MCNSRGFPETEPDALDPEKRWSRVLTLVNRFIDNGDIVLLQELNAQWVNRLAIAMASRATVLSVAATVSKPDALIVATIVPLAYRCDDVRFFAARDILGAVSQTLRDELQNYNQSIWLRLVPNYFSADCSELALALKAPGRGLLVRVTSGSESVYVFNHHLPCRFEPIDDNVSPATHFHIKGVIKFLESLGSPIVWGGDFNCTTPNMERIIGGVSLSDVINRTGAQSTRSHTTGEWTLCSVTTTYFCRVAERGTGEVKQFRSAIDHFLVRGFREHSVHTHYAEKDIQLGPNLTQPSDHIPVTLVCRQ